LGVTSRVKNCTYIRSGDADGFYKLASERLKPPALTGRRENPMDILTLSASAIHLRHRLRGPGPGIAASWRAGWVAVFAAPCRCARILVGDLIYLTFAAFGLAAKLELFGAVFTVIRYLSAAICFHRVGNSWTAKPGNEQVGPRAKEHWTKNACSPACR